MQQVTSAVVEQTETVEVEAPIEDAFERFAREVVGRIGLKEAQALLRVAMHGEALRQVAGSRRAAARVLGVDRRYVQRLAKERDEAEARLHLAPTPRD
jgi:hypothetical protein